MSGVGEGQKPSKNNPGEMHYTFDTPHAIYRKIDFSPSGGMSGVGEGQKPSRNVPEKK